MAKPLRRAYPAKRSADTNKGKPDCNKYLENFFVTSCPELTQIKCYRGGELDGASEDTLTQVRGYRSFVELPQN